MLIYAYISHITSQITDDNAVEAMKKIMNE